MRKALAVAALATSAPLGIGACGGTSPYNRGYADGQSVAANPAPEGMQNEYPVTQGDTTDDFCTTLRLSLPSVPYPGGSQSDNDYLNGFDAGCAAWVTANGEGN